MEAFGGCRNEDEVESISSRGEVTSELEITDSGLEEVEEALGFSPDEAFDRFDEKNFESSDYETEAAVRPDGEEMVLEGQRNISPRSLAHESVHGVMMQPDACNYLPGNNQFENTLYDEFVARMAEDEIRSLEVAEEALQELKDAHENYMEAREQYVGDVFSEEFDSLYEDVLDLERIDNTEVQKQMDELWRPYQGLREQVLAAKAAKEYRQENDVDIRDFVKPDRKLYEDAMGYIKQVETEIYG